jgi:predicted dehydrogenase
LEAIVNVFGLPKSVSGSVRKLPRGEKHPIVSCWYDMHQEELDPTTTEYTVGELPYEDIGSAILEYETHNVVVDFTAWEPTNWCEDWGINIYGTNGAFHGVLNPPDCRISLRSARAGYAEGTTQMETKEAKGVSNQFGYYQRQIDLLFQRVIHGSVTECAGIEVQTKLMKVLQAIYTSASERRFVDIV